MHVIYPTIQKRIFFTLLILLVLLLSITFTFRPPKMGFLAVSKVYIEPTGYEDPNTKEWVGSYWIVTATSFTNEEFLFYKFDKEEASKPYVDNKIGDKTLIPNATVKVKVSIGTPYWQIRIKRVSYMVYPETYTTAISKLLPTSAYKLNDTVAPALYAKVYELDGTWELHIPFTIEVTKEGSYTKTVKKTIDVVGVESTVPIKLTLEDNEHIYVNLQGQLGTGYGQPTFDDLIIFDRENIFFGSEVRRIIQYDADPNSYSIYWFGTERWEDDNSPAFYTKEFNGVWYNYYPLATEDLPGIYRDDSLVEYRVRPISADIRRDNPDATPYGYSLINYIKNVLKYQPVNLDIYQQGFTLDMKRDLIKIYMPKGSVAWLYTLKISTELADTFVYRPIVGKGKIVSAYFATTSSQEASIGASDYLIVEVKQEADVESRLTVSISYPEDYPMSITPSSQSEVIPPGKSVKFKFKVTNLGATQELRGTIKVDVLNDLGTITDTTTLSFTLIPKAEEMNTLLTVYTIDRETQLKVSGITVVISYGTESTTGITSGGYVQFDLGNYQGGVEITTVSTPEYYPANKSVTVKAGENVVFIELQPRNAPAEAEPGLSKYLWIIILVSIIAILAIIIIYMMMYTRVRPG